MKYKNIKSENYSIIEAQKKKKETVLSGYPYWLQIDPSSICSLKCPFCPTGNGKNVRRPALLEIELFKNVIDELGPYLIHADFFKWGEPFFNPHLPEMIKYAKRYEIDTRVDTSLNLFDEALAERIVDSGLDHIILSIDGTTEATYGKYRVGGCFEQVMKNAGMLMKAKKAAKSIKPFVIWQFLVFRHNENEIGTAKSMAESLGFDGLHFCAPYVSDTRWVSTIEEYRLMNYEIKNDTLDFRSSGKPSLCNWLWDAMVINSTGSVSACCSIEEEKDDIFKSYSDQPIEFKWNTEKYTKARKRIAEGSPDEESSDNRCLRCRHWGLNNHRDISYPADQ